MRTISFILIVLSLSACSTTTYRMYWFTPQKNTLNTGQVEFVLRPEKTITGSEEMREAWPFRLQARYRTTRRDVQMVEMEIHSLRGESGKLSAQRQIRRQTPLSANMRKRPTTDQSTGTTGYQLYLNAQLLLEGLDIDYEKQFLTLNMRVYGKHGVLLENVPMKYTLNTAYQEYSYAKWLYDLGW